jgi:hypothetical protein
MSPIEVKCPNPLDPAACNILNAILKSTAETAALIQRCEQCGIPMGDRGEQNQAQQDLAAKIKAAFFPLAP